MKLILMCCALFSLPLSAAASPPLEHPRDAVVHQVDDQPQLAPEGLVCLPDVEVHAIAELPAASAYDQVRAPEEAGEFVTSYDSALPPVPDGIGGEQLTVTDLMRRATLDLHRIDDIASAKPIPRLRC